MTRSALTLPAMPIDFLHLVISACAVADLPSVGATSSLMEETSRRRRQKLAVVLADPFNVRDIHKEGG